MNVPDIGLSFLREKLLPAEEQWIKCITDERSDHYFTIEKEKWFDDPEKEMAKIYEKNKINAIDFFEKIKQSDELQNASGKRLIDEKEVNNIKTKIKRTTRNVSKWQLSKFDFYNAKISSIICIAGLFCLLSSISMLGVAV